MGGRIVVMKEPVVVMAELRSFSLYTISQASQNVTVNVRVDHGVTRNKFMTNNPIYFEKNNEHALCLTPYLLHLFFALVIMGPSTATTVAFFLDHNHKFNFRQPLRV
jgi:hypothetical protein